MNIESIVTLLVIGLLIFAASKFTRKRFTQPAVVDVPGQDPATTALLALAEKRDKERRRWWLNGVGGLILIYFLVSSFHNTTVESFAKTFVREEFDKRKHFEWKVGQVIIPPFATVSPSYNVNIEVTKVGGEKKILTANINGSCLIGSCAISMRGWELLGL